MKKNIFYNLLYMFLLVSLVACYPDAPEESTISSYAPFSVEGLTDMTVDEEDVSIPMNFTMNENQILDVDVLITVDESSTATLHEDFDLSAEEVSVLALGGAGSFSVDIHQDLEAEGDETIVLNVGGAPPLGLPTSQQITITIKNKVLPVSLLCEWDVAFQYAGTTLFACPYVDVDLLIIDADGNEASGYATTTGACPEASPLAAIGLADGSYSLVADLWSNGLNGAGLGDVEMPLTVSILKGGSLDKFSFNSKDVGAPVWNGETVGTADGGSPAYTLGTLVVAGTSFTLIDYNGNNLGTLSD